MHDLLLQKSNGVFDLVVWDERPGGGTDGVTVSLSVPRPMVKVFDPTIGVSPTQSFPGAYAVPLTLNDHPLVLEVTP